jgi:hypothetical protein
MTTFAHPAQLAHPQHDRSFGAITALVLFTFMPWENRLRFHGDFAEEKG